MHSMLLWRMLSLIGLPSDQKTASLRCQGRAGTLNLALEAKEGDQNKIHEIVQKSLTMVLGKAGRAGSLLNRTGQGKADEWLREIGRLSCVAFYVPHMFYLYNSQLCYRREYIARSIVRICYRHLGYPVRISQRK